ncbi:hypothetical protein [Actinomadura chokoriensis]|uniref:Peptidoglycan endopeptidase n=1 Tax=Actinomadura chokoriensis TaxID=454156 RepID=A0ABV4R884_9ACTN
MNGKHSRNKGLFGLSRRANGALAGIAVVGVAAATVHLADSPPETAGQSVAAVKSIPQQRTSEPDTSVKADGERASAEPKRTSAKPKRTVAEPKRTLDKRSEVIARAKTWNPHSEDRVPYSQTRYHEGYRTDCSGFVSMALGLPKPGENTVGLTSSRFTERIKMSELKKGDLVMDAEGSNTTRHVVIFEKWANSAHTSYWAYEQRGRYGTDYRTRDYGLSSGSEYKAYRPTKLSDA